MFARRLSVVLSISALGLMALACSLGYQGRSERPPAAEQVVTATAVVTAKKIPTRCQELDLHLDQCSQALQRVWKPPVPAHYPPRLQRLISIKKRYQLEKDAARACEGTPDAPVAGAELHGCLSRPTCDDFARCVADSLDDF